MVDTVTFIYSRYLSQTKKIQDVEKWVKLSTSWKKITFGTKPYCSAQSTKPTAEAQLSEGSILALCKEGRIYRIVGRMKYELRAERLGAEWYKICTNSYLGLHNCVSVP